MNKFWLVAREEYKKRASKKSFLVGTLLIPIVYAIIIAATIFIIARDVDTRPLGYVDHSGVLAAGLRPTLEEDEFSVEFIAFENETLALTALEDGLVQGVYVIPADYLANPQVELYFWDESPKTMIQRDFDDLLRANLLPAGPSPVQTRIIEGFSMALTSADRSREFTDETGFITVMFPLVVAMFFIFAVMSASGYFLQAITDEKENRTMEIAITSISPLQLIAGKATGLIGVALTQIAIWLTTLVVGWLIILQQFPELKTLKLPWDILLVFVFFFIPSFALIGGLMAVIGSAVTELQEGQQIAGILNLLFTFPLFLTALVFANPDSPLLIFLSFWPTTSFLTITLRWGLTIIPVWQIVVSWLLLIGSDAITIWVAAQVFRIGMLHYGQKLSFKAIINAIQTSLEADRHA